MDYKKKYLKYKLKYLNKLKNKLRGGEHQIKQGQIIWKIPKKRLDDKPKNNPTSSWLLMPLIAAALSSPELGEGVFFPNFFNEAFNQSISDHSAIYIPPGIETLTDLINRIRVKCNSFNISTWKDIVYGNISYTESENFKLDKPFPNFHMPPNQQEFLVDSESLGNLIMLFITKILELYITEDGEINPEYNEEVISFIYNDNTSGTDESASRDA